MLVHIPRCMYNCTCRYSFNFTGAIVISHYYYYHYYYPVHVHDLNCTGTESSIWDCPYDNIIEYCGYYEDAAVLCQCKSNIHVIVSYNLI